MLKIAAIGHLGKDATTNTHNGKTVINFSVAHTEKYNNQEKTVWLECSYWTDKTGVLPYLKKGTQVYVEGGADVRQWESNGKQGASLTCRVLSIQLLGSGDKQQATQQGATGYTANHYPANTGHSNEQSDDLPFFTSRTKPSLP